MTTGKSRGRIMVIQLPQDFKALKGLASEVRLRILEILRSGERNVNEIKDEMGLPQSTVATNVMLLEEANLIETRSVKAAKGTQKICAALYDEFVVQFSEAVPEAKDAIEVEMPIGLFIEYAVSPPCGMCSTEKIIGYLDTPASFLEPERVKAGLLWFEKGYVVYQFPNNALYQQKPVRRLEVTAELSSETPGTNPQWRSDITLWVNGVEVGTWVSPGDYGDKRGTYTPSWWKLEGSQYGLNKVWSVSKDGSYVDGMQVSGVTISDLNLSEHHSVKVKIGIKDDAEHVGGVNIFGRGFGNYDQDIVLRMYL
ncbi:MAG TPA: helix-turn-helix domain-containing protein [Spirochaetia bacterium]|nr:helix-turn-helix domain-containing protein [Spirochaetia bacterium]